MRTGGFTRERGVFLSVCIGAEAVCCAGIREPDRDFGEVKRVYARPNSNGTGRKLMRAPEGRASAFGCTGLKP